MYGVRLQLLHPGMRSCGDCQQFLYYDRGEGDFGERVERGGKPVLRPKGVKTPCRWCPKIPPGDDPVPASAAELDEKNFAAYLHYLECKAVGNFPNDPIVRRNAALIRQAEDAVEQVRQARTGVAVLQGLRVRAASD